MKHIIVCYEITCACVLRLKCAVFEEKKILNQKTTGYTFRNRRILIIG